jgi:hypothetical protein
VARCKGVAHSVLGPPSIDPTEILVSKKPAGKVPGAHGTADTVDVARAADRYGLHAADTASTGQAAMRTSDEAKLQKLEKRR